MLRKRFKKILPSHEAVRSNRFIALFGRHLRHPNLWHLNRRSVAGGVAVGLLCGLIPGPLQMLGGALLAVVFRVNLPVAVFGTLYTNPLTIVPLYYLAYKLGMLVTGQDSGALPEPALEFHISDIGAWIGMLSEWMTAMGRPFVLGLVLLASSLALAGYVAVRLGWRLYVILLWRRRARRRHAA